MKSFQKGLLIGILLLGVLAAGFFGTRAVRSFMRLRAGPPPGAADVQAIRGWMTVPYVAHTYHVPPEMLYAAVGVPPQGNDRKSLSELNRLTAPGQQGVVIERVREAILKFQQPAPPQPPSPPGAPNGGRP